jgi:hypothetical protein
MKKLIMFLSIIAVFLLISFTLSDARGHGGGGFHGGGSRGFSGGSSHSFSGSRGFSGDRSFSAPRGFSSFRGGRGISRGSFGFRGRIGARGYYGAYFWPYYYNNNMCWMSAYWDYDPYTGEQIWIPGGWVPCY